jgi:hypothetical protein
MMSESRRQAVTLCLGLLWLLSGSGFVLGEPADALVTKESRDWKQWSGISSLFVKQESQNFEKDKKVDESLEEAVSEEVPADTYSGASHLSIIWSRRRPKRWSSNIRVLSA